MPIEFKHSDVQIVLDTFESMEAQIDLLGKEVLFQGLEAWQIVDMHRKYPNTTQETERSVYTSIWPTSRVGMLLPLLKIPGKTPRKVYAPPRTTGHHRPILRHELFDVLVERMAVLMTEMLKWQTKH